MNIPRWERWPHVLEMQQFSQQDLLGIIKHASLFEDALAADRKLPRLSRRKRQANKCRKKRRIRTLFYEPSTRTETTFDDAAAELGCSLHPVKDPKTFSSAAKGESLEWGTAAYGPSGILQGCDGIVMRHDREGACKQAADVIDRILSSHQSRRSLFLINAGDGPGQHPTQALVDLATFYRKRERKKRFLDGETILFPGELDKSRVVNSLLYSFGKFPDCRVRVLLCCPPGMGPKEELLHYLTSHRVTYEFVEEADFPEAIRKATIIYMTRVQRERKKKGRRAVKINREAYVFWYKYLKLLQPGAFLAHPLPINEDPRDPPPEIDPRLFPLAFSGDERLAMLGQSHRGFPMRSALFDLIFAGLDAGWKCKRAT